MAWYREANSQFLGCVNSRHPRTPLLAFSFNSSLFNYPSSGPIQCQGTNTIITMPSRATHSVGNGTHPVQGLYRPAPIMDLSRLGGLIMWLPALDGLPTHSKLPELCYDHPVVILSPQASSPTDNVVVLIVGALLLGRVHEACGWLTI